MSTTSRLTDVFIQANAHRERRDGGRPRLIVVHDMEAPETLTMAEDLGRNWFAKPAAGYASTHYGVDANSVVGYVSEDRAAYGANRVANNNGLHIEQAGYAKQTRAEWLDPYGVAQLDRMARLIADRCDHYRIPIVFLTSADLIVGRIDGITTHAECSKAWGGDHTDPGPWYPIDTLMASVRDWHNAPNRRPILIAGDHDGKASLGEGPAHKGAGIVTHVQKRLLAHGLALPKWGDDGDFGGETTAAVLAARALFGMPSQPIVDRQLWAALEQPPAKPTPPAPIVVEPAPDRVAVETAAIDRLERQAAAVLALIREMRP